MMEFIILQSECSRKTVPCVHNYRFPLQVIISSIISKSTTIPLRNKMLHLTKIVNVFVTSKGAFIYLQLLVCCVIFVHSFTIVWCPTISFLMNPAKYFFLAKLLWEELLQYSYCSGPHDVVQLLCHHIPQDVKAKQRKQWILSYL